MVPAPEQTAHAVETDSGTMFICDNVGRCNSKAGWRDVVVIDGLTKVGTGVYPDDNEYIALDSAGKPHRFQSYVFKEITSFDSVSQVMQGPYTQISADNDLSLLAFLDENAKIHVFQIIYDGTGGSQYADLTPGLEQLAAGSYRSVSVSRSHKADTASNIFQGGKDINVVAVDTQGEVHWYSAPYAYNQTSAEWVNKTGSEGFSQALSGKSYAKADISFRARGREDRGAPLPDTTHEDDATLALLGVDGKVTWASRYGKQWSSRGEISSKLSDIRNMDFYMIDQDGKPQMSGAVLDSTGKLYQVSDTARFEQSPTRPLSAFSSNDDFLEKNTFREVSISPQYDLTAFSRGTVAGIIGTPSPLEPPAPSDTIPPTITTPGDRTIQLGEQFDPMQGVTATDDVDGDITANIKINGTVDNTQPGEYTLTYTATDKAGNTATATRKITVANAGTTIACAPQTGADPAATVWQSLTALTGLLTLGLAAVVLRMRVRLQRQL